MERREELNGPGFSCWNRCLSTRVQEEAKTIAHRSMGRLDLRLASCVTADTADLSISCAAQMEASDSSKELGSLTSAGTRVFKSSTVGFGSEFEVVRTDVEVDGCGCALDRTFVS